MERFSSQPRKRRPVRTYPSFRSGDSVMPILPRGSNMEPEIRTKFVQSVAEAFGYALSDEIEIEQPAEELPTEE